MPGELSRRDCPIFPSLPDLKRWEQLIQRENDFERSHALMVSACSTTCGSMAIVRIRRQDLLELFVEWTRKWPGKNHGTKIPWPKSERHNVPTRWWFVWRVASVWEFYSGAKSQSHMGPRPLLLLLPRTAPPFLFQPASWWFNVFPTRILRQLPWIFTWVSEWSVSDVASKSVWQTQPQQRKRTACDTLSTHHMARTKAHPKRPCA